MDSISFLMGSIKLFEGKLPDNFKISPIEVEFSTLKIRNKTER